MVALVALPVLVHVLEAMPFTWALALGIRGNQLSGIMTALLALIDAALVLFLCLHLRGLAKRVLDRKLRRETLVILGAFALGLLAVFATMVAAAFELNDAAAGSMLALVVVGTAVFLLWIAYCDAFGRAAAAARAGELSTYAGARAGHGGPDEDPHLHA
jgi:hypothetical protein